MRRPKVESFLIVRTSALGDVVHGVPVAVALKERFPRCRIGWVVERRYEDLLVEHPCVDERIVVRFREGGRGVGGWRRIFGNRGYDVAVDLQGLIRSGWLSRLSGARIRIGFPWPEARESLNVLFTNLRPTRIPARAHVVDKNLALLHPLGIRATRGRFRFRPPEPADEGIRRFFGRPGGRQRRWRVAIQPAAGWPTKVWAPERYARIGDRVSGSWDAEVFVLWGPGERDLAERVCDGMRRPARLVPEMGVGALAAFLARCDLLVSGDSGPLHMAVALGIPVVGLYGPSDPVRNGPYGGRFRVVRGVVPCGPCYRRRCARRDCMEAIGVEAVWEALVSLKEEIAAAGAPSETDAIPG